MDSTSTSSSIVVRFTDYDGEATLDVPAYEASSLSGHIEPTTVGILDEDHFYSIRLLSDVPIESDSIEVSVNEGDFVRGRIRLVKGNSGDAEPYEYDVFNLDRGYNRPGQRSLFEQTYGLVRIEFKIPNMGSFITMDVPCACAITVKHEDVRSMLETLLDDGEQSIANWMFAQDSERTANYAILEIGAGKDTTLSLTSFLDTVSVIIKMYESAYPYFRSSAHCLVTRTTKRVSGLKARQIGSREFNWLMKNGEVFSSVSIDAGVRYHGKHYFPSSIRTDIKNKSFDCRENRIVLSFLTEVTNALHVAESKLASALESINGYVERLTRIRENRELPALIVMEECVRRERNIIDRMRGLRSKTMSLHAIYRSALPGVAEVKTPSEHLRTTKVFQEVHAYSEIYTAIMMWKDFDDFTLARESLALHVLRLDKLYEYYALYRLLEALKQYGYDVDSSVEEPIRHATYELTAPLYENERIVNTLYHLTDGHAHLKLYYQPVIYGSGKEEHGIVFHRKSPRSGFKSMVEDSYYTPDYMLVVDVSSIEKTYMLDAKYSEIDMLTKTDRKHPTSRFDEAKRKYISDIASSSKDSPDAMWLLAGKESDPTIRPSHASSWFSSQEGYVESGVAPLSPIADGLGELFELLGIISSRGEYVDVGEKVTVEFNDYAENDKDNRSPSDTLNTLDAVLQRHDNSVEEPVSEREKDDDPLSLAVRLVEMHVNKAQLYDQAWAMKELGQNRPVLRVTAPRGKRELGFYTTYDLSGNTVFLLKHWRKNQLVRLKKLVLKYECGKASAQ